MLRLLTLTTAVSAIALTAAAQPAPTPQTDPAPPVSQSPPVTADPQDPVTQDADQSPSSTSAMPSTPAQSSQAETPPASGAMQRPAGDTATTPAAPQAGATGATPAAGGNIVAVLRANGQFTMLLAALDTAQLTTTLEGSDREFTLFAPTDAAIGAVPEAQRTALMADPPALQRLLLHHVFGARVTGAQLRQARGTPTGLAMADNTRQAVTGEGDTLMLGAATVTQADIAASNGVIHAVDAVIMPAGAAATAAPPTAATPPASPTPASGSATPAPTTPPTGG